MLPNQNSSQQKSQNAMFKPKFAPKIPVKKEENETESQQVTESSNKGENKEQIKEKFKVKREGNKERNQGKGGRGNQRDSREPWVMPAGPAFFTGNASNQAPPKAKPSFSIPVRSDSSQQKIYRPNEAIDEDEVNTVPPHSDLPPEPALEDTDSDGSVDHDDRSHRTLESWPPKKYHQMEPLSLPFGPKTAALRKALNSEPILAAPDDSDALDQEERTSLFLLQIPSDLRMDKDAAGKRVQIKEESEQSSNGYKTGTDLLDKQGRLGKLQLLKSGRVRLVTTDGRSFEVNGGLTSCFLQTLLTVEHTPDTAAPQPQGISAPSSSAKNQKPQKSKDAEQLKETGTVHFMGNITRKLVITPSYELGVKRNGQTGAGRRRAAESPQEEEEAGLEELPDDFAMDVEN